MKNEIFTSAPFLLFARLIDTIEIKWLTWRAWCRARYLFPSAENLSISLSTKFKHLENIEIGDNVLIGPGVTIGAHAKITISDFVRISEGVLIETAGLDINKPLHYPHISKPIRVERGAWIGAKAIILGGVTIGEQAVIGAGAVVTKNVAAHAIIVGHPPRQLQR